jgi:hypothetical protein
MATSVITFHLGIERTDASTYNNRNNKKHISLSPKKHIVDAVEKTFKCIV